MYDTIAFESAPHGVSVRQGLFDRLAKSDKLIHIVTIATKPDIIKQAPIVLELRKRGEEVLVCHTGQHHDWNLSGGMLEKDFGIEPDINLNISGNLFEKHSQIVFRLGQVLAKLRKMGKTVLPYVHGDTLTATAAGAASFFNQYATAHVEAGIRSMGPPKALLDKLAAGMEPRAFFEECLKVQWEKGALEPYPEQYDTRSAAPTAGFHFAPVELVRQHLLAEGYSPDRIFVVGNTVADAVRHVDKAGKESKIFEQYPLLAEGKTIRFCIHRRENVASKHRFTAIFNAMARLVEEGQPVLLISLAATEKALAQWGLKGRVDELARKHKHFIYSPVWPFYTDVIAATKRCALIATDSGSMQEEANILKVPCATLRFNSDRPESLMAGANILAPPISEDVVYRIVKAAANDQAIRSRMIEAPDLYGSDVSKRIVDVVTSVHAKERIWRFDHNRLGFAGQPSWLPEEAAE